MTVFFEHAHINGIEAIEEVVAGSHLEPTQLAAGPISGSMTHLRVGEALISTADITGKFRAYGPLSTADYTLGALLAVDGPNSQWDYETISGDIAVVPPSIEHDAKYGKSTHWATITLPLEDLLNRSSLYELKLCTAFWDTPAMYRPTASRRRHVIDRLHSALQHVEKYPRILEASYARKAFLDDMIEALLRGYADVKGDEIKRRISFVSASRIVRNAESYLRMHAQRPVHLQELCEHTNTSERTLRRAFIEKYDMPPARYLGNWRLCQVRRTLSASNKLELTVSDAAFNFGFWELGRFASQYRRLFGELPSQTLRDARTCRDST